MFSSVIERLNDRRDGAGEAGEDAGFTLIELMVVLLIMAILLAIAIPTFLGVSGSANDRAAQSNLNTALTNAKSYFQSNSQSYRGRRNGTHDSVDAGAQHQMDDRSFRKLQSGQCVHGFDDRQRRHPGLPVQDWRVLVPRGQRAE